MTQPLPYEPVSYGWMFPEDEVMDDWWVFGDAEWESLSTDAASKDTLEDDRMCVTLANGQRIIVRALSEDRKAARAEARRANRLEI